MSVDVSSADKSTTPHTSLLKKASEMTTATACSRPSENLLWTSVTLSHAAKILEDTIKRLFLERGRIIASLE